MIIKGELDVGEDIGNNEYKMRLMETNLVDLLLSEFNLIEYL